MDPLDIFARSIIFVLVLVVGFLALRFIIAFIRWVFRVGRGINPHSLGRASAAVESKVSGAIREFKDGRRSSS